MAAISGKPHDERSEYSVGELLRIRMGGDRWHLALVQRDEVWDVERMKRLLDSLLAGYPVGALLLCRTDEVPSKVIDRDEDEETVREAPEGAYQLLDGQQRLNALYTMLTASDEKHRKYGRFYLDLTVARQPPSPAGTGRRGPAMPYLVWREGPDGPLGQGEYDAFDSRGRCLNLSRLYDWAEVDGGVASGEALLASGPEVLAKEIDPQFTHALGDPEREVAAGWLRRILRMWTTPIVPVMRATVGAPEDILELFARLNRSGIPVRDADIRHSRCSVAWIRALRRWPSWSARVRRKQQRRGSRHERALEIARDRSWARERRLAFPALRWDSGSSVQRCSPSRSCRDGDVAAEARSRGRQPHCGHPTTPGGGAPPAKERAVRVRVANPRRRRPQPQGGGLDA